MSYIFRERGKSAVRCMQVLSTSPAELMTLWDAYACRYVRAPYAPVKSFKPLGGDWDVETTIQGLLGGHGVLRSGTWRIRQGHLDSKAQMIVHLPTVLENFQQLYLTCPPLVYLMQMFLPIVARRSLVAADYMARDLRNQAHQILVLEVEDRVSLMDGIPDPLPREVVPHPDYPVEAAYYSRILHQLATDKPFISALRGSIEATFNGWASVKSMRRYVANLASTGVLCDNTKKNYQVGCCVFRPGQVQRLTYAPKVQLRPDALLQAYKRHYRPQGRGVVPELLRVMELGAPLPSEEGSIWRRRVVELGVALFKDRITKESFYFIDWSRWFKYRVLTTGTFFRESLVSKLVEDKDQGKMKEEMTLAEFYQYITQAFPVGKSTVFIPPETVEVPSKLVAAWGLTTESPVSVISPETVLNKSYTLLARERNWTGVLAKEGVIARPPRKRQFADLPFAVDIMVPGPAPVEQINGVHAGRKVYFQVPGTYQDFMVRTGRNSLGLRYLNLRKGVLRKRSGYYFTAAFIRENREYFPRITDAHMSQLDIFGRYTRAELRRYIKTKMPAVCTGPKTGFSRLEDETIIALYRPVMTSLQLSQLWEVCANRTPHNIQCRARALRKKLILEGVFDKAKLPHRRYNANIGKEIGAAKRLIAPKK